MLFIFSTNASYHNWLWLAAVINLGGSTMDMMCRGLCQAPFSFPCQCDIVCTRYEHCCHSCTTETQRTFPPWITDDHLKNATSECLDEGIFVVTGCNKGSQDIARDRRWDPRHDILRRLPMPIFDRSTGVNYKDYKSFECYSTLDSVPVFWEMRASLHTPLVRWGSMSSILDVFEMIAKTITFIAPEDAIIRTDKPAHRCKKAHGGLDTPFSLALNIRENLEITMRLSQDDVYTNVVCDTDYQNCRQAPNVEFTVKSIITTPSLTASKIESLAQNMQCLLNQHPKIEQVNFKGEIARPVDDSNWDDLGMYSILFEALVDEEFFPFLRRHLSDVVPVAYQNLGLGKKDEATGFLAYNNYVDEFTTSILPNAREHLSQSDRAATDALSLEGTRLESESKRASVLSSTSPNATSVGRRAKRESNHTHPAFIDLTTNDYPHTQTSEYRNNKITASTHRNLNMSSILPLLRPHHQQGMVNKYNQIAAPTHQHNTQITEYYNNTMTSISTQALTNNQPQKTTVPSSDAVEKAETTITSGDKHSKVPPPSLARVPNAPDTQETTTTTSKTILTTTVISTEVSKNILKSMKKMHDDAQSKPTTGTKPSRIQTSTVQHSRKNIIKPTEHRILTPSPITNSKQTTPKTVTTPATSSITNSKQTFLTPKTTAVTSQDLQSKSVNIFFQMATEDDQISLATPTTTEKSAMNKRRPRDPNVGSDVDIVMPERRKTILIIPNKANTQTTPSSPATSNQLAKSDISKTMFPKFCFTSSTDKSLRVQWTNCNQPFQFFPLPAATLTKDSKCDVHFSTQTADDEEEGEKDFGELTGNDGSEGEPTQTNDDNSRVRRKAKIHVIKMCALMLLQFIVLGYLYRQ